MVCNPYTLSTTSNTDTIQCTSTSRQNTLPSTTVNTTPHCTGSTLPNVNDDIVYEVVKSGGDTPSHSDLNDHTD